MFMTRLPKWFPEQGSRIFEIGRTRAVSLNDPWMASLTPAFQLQIVKVFTRKRIQGGRVELLPGQAFSSRQALRWRAFTFNIARAPALPTMA